MTHLTIAEAARDLRARRVSSLELLEESLALSRRWQGLVNAFLTFMEEGARAAAKAADEDFAKGVDRGPLQGIPVALKDLFYTKGVRTTAGSKIFGDFLPDFDAGVVERLKAAGAVISGKLGMHELAFGITNNNAHYGPVRNAWDRERIPGGSSGGSGVAVSTGMVFAALGSDTGGSIRIPASYCGTAGLKPTYGLVSRYGSFPLGYTLDHMGPLARTSQDCLDVLNAIAGPDARDPYCINAAWTPIRLAPGQPMAGIKIGWSEEFFFTGVDPEIRAMVEGALRAWHEWGAELVELKLAWLKDVVSISHVILPAEAASTAEGFLHRREELGAEVRPLFEAGRLIPAVDYLQAQKLRRQYRAKAFQEIWSRCDVLVGPTTSITAPRIGEQQVKLADGTELEVRTASTQLVRAFNVLGVPAHSIVGGFHSNGLPMGLQIVGAPFAEQKVLHTATRFEEETQHYRKTPPVGV